MRMVKLMSCEEVLSQLMGADSALYKEYDAERIHDPNYVSCELGWCEEIAAQISVYNIKIDVDDACGMIVVDPKAIQQIVQWEPVFKEIKFEELPESLKKLFSVSQDQK